MPAQTPAQAAQPADSEGSVVKRLGLLASLAALVAVVMMPTPQGLPEAGQGDG